MFELNLSEKIIVTNGVTLLWTYIHRCSTNSAILANEIAFIEFFTFLIVNQKDHISL